MIAQTIIRRLADRGISLALSGEGIAVEPSSALTDEDRQAIRASKAELLELLTSGHLCPGCAGEMRLQDRARDVWWCPACRRWADGQGRPLPKTENPKPVERVEEDARKLIADLKAAGCAFVYEDGELRLQFPSRMSAGLWARFESAGDVFRRVVMEAAVCDESIDDESSRALLK
jgi:ribosomal protein L37AE/L43A